ncbi:ricin-type beta-trefoil lectin domain protein [Pelagibaculum spongiae]|nr:ricin-type beta-trefoil lectin domain protein [Pelagibaculum spongiae]
MMTLKKSAWLRSKALSIKILFPLIFLATFQAHGFSFYNDLKDHTYSVNIDGPSDFSQNVSPKSAQSCHWSNTGCNPGGDRFGLLTANIHIDSLDFHCKVSFQAGGFVRVRYSEGYLQCHGYDTFGTTRDVNPVQVNNNQRSVRFLATADPQYDNTDFNRNGISDRTLSVAGNMIKSSNNIRGLIVAGDLTQNSRKDERELFERATWPVRDYLYEGMGNHDDKDPLWYQRLACPLLNSCVSPFDIMNSINHQRNSLLQKEQHEGGLYSWDWQDVHVAQLGTFIANEPRANTVRYQFEDINPYNSLDFLKADLRDNVGPSGRPVILISHYGFDSRSLGPWSHQQRVKMWEALDGYNVVAIISGHDHSSPGYEWYRNVNRPFGTQKGPAVILNVTAGAALFKVFVDVEISGNTMTINRMTFDHEDRPYSIDSVSGDITANYQASEQIMQYQNIENNRCLQRSGYLVAISDCNGADKWVHEESSERLRHIESNQCLYNSGGNRLVSIANCNNESNQKWFWSGEQIKNRSNYQCLDLFRNENKAGVWNCHNGNNQKWRRKLR